MSIHDETRLKRLSFRAWRRGFREADLILGPFVDAHARDLSPEELDALESLLAYPDQDLYGWIIQREPPPANWPGSWARSRVTTRAAVVGRNASVPP